MAKDAVIFERESVLFEQVPKVTFYHDEVIHGFENGMESLSRFLFNVNRLLTPLHSLKNEQEILDFFESPDKVYYKEYMTPFFKKAKDQDRLKGELTEDFEKILDILPLKTRVIVFFYGTDEYKQEIDDLRMGARFSSTREDLRVAYVTDENLVKKMRRKNPDWFDRVGYSSAVIKRYDGVIVKFDITAGDKINFSQWINKNSMKPGEAFNNVVSRMYEMVRMPVLMLFCDPKSKDGVKKMNSGIRVLEKLAPKYSHVLGFVFTDKNNWNPQRLKMLGINVNKPFP